MINTMRQLLTISVTTIMDGYMTMIKIITSYVPYVNVF